MQQSSEHTATSETGFVKDQTGENHINLTLTVHVHESINVSQFLKDRNVLTLTILDT